MSPRARIVNLGQATSDSSKDSEGLSCPVSEAQLHPDTVCKVPGSWGKRRIGGFRNVGRVTGAKHRKRHDFHDLGGIRPETNDRAFAEWAP